MERVIPVQVMVALIKAPQPKTPSQAPAPPIEKVLPAQPKPTQPKPVAAPAPAPAPAPTPQPVALAEPTPVPEAPTGITALRPAPPALLAAVSESAPTPPAPTAPPAPPRLEQPSSNADYLNNPRPPYPALSKRLGEQGQVVLRVFIETNGTATQAEIHSSSGYERLDQTALQTVLKWRYVPGKRNGVAEAMWFNVPIHFVLD